MQTHKRPPSSLIFIFGGSGDLNHRKLTPALYNLFIDQLMPEKFDIVGIGRTQYTNESYHDFLLQGIKEFSRRKGEQNGQWKDYSKHVSYLNMNAEDENAYGQIAGIVKEKEKEFGEHPNVIFYLAVAPQLVPDISSKLCPLNICADT